jgi:hypothetical protein
MLDFLPVAHPQPVLGEEDLSRDVAVDRVLEQRLIEPEIGPGVAGPEFLLQPGAWASA